MSRRKDMDLKRSKERNMRMYGERFVQHDSSNEEMMRSMMDSPSQGPSQGEGGKEN